MSSKPAYAGGVAALTIVVACSAGSSSSKGAGGSGGSGGSTSSHGATSSGHGGATVASSSSGVGGFNPATTGAGGNGPMDYKIWAHTDTTLFSLDPKDPNLALTQVGSFDCIGGMNQDTSMTDFAVDSNLNLWGVSSKFAYPLTVMGSTVHCGTPIPFTDPKAKFYALTFAPAGVIDPMKEVLVAGNTAGELWAIDGGGNLSQHGQFGSVPKDDGNGHTYASKNVGKAWELSGDIVFLANNGSPVGFATVRDCPNPPSTSNCNPVNTLIEIDVPKVQPAGAQSVIKSVRGQIVQAQGCNDGTNGDYGNMYGIAAWNDKVYGFSRTGNLVEISVTDGSACLVKAYASDKFAGAGVTTLAPIMPPPPK